MVISPVRVWVTPGISRSSGAIGVVMSRRPPKVMAVAAESRTSTGDLNRRVSKIEWRRGGNACENVQSGAPVARTTTRTESGAAVKVTSRAMPVKGPEAPVPVTLTPSAVSVRAVTGDRVR